MKTAVDLAYDEIMERFPGLEFERRKFRREHFNPTHVILPARLNVPYTGEDADLNFKGTCFGLPIIWSEEEQWGFAFILPEGKKT